jgi:small subunit ribosomal protein S6
LFRPQVWTSEPKGGCILRRYETIVITHADCPDDEIQSIIDKYKVIIEGRKGLVVKIDKWGKRKLAYEIKKVSRGFYILFDFVGQAEAVDELERNLNIDDKILKFMTVKTNDKVDIQEIEKEMTAPAEGEKQEPQPIKIIAEANSTEKAPAETTAT